MESDKTLYSLVNPEFDFSIGEKTFTLRKATLDKAIQYQKRAKELSQNKEESPDQKLLAYCIYIMLKDKDETITETWVLQNTPASADIIGILGQLGFINPAMLQTIQQLAENKNKSLEQNSSVSLPNEQDGNQVTSEN